MYRLHLNFKDDSGVFGLGRTKEYFLYTSDDVCSVLSALSGIDVVITLVEIKFSTVDDVKRDFLLLPLKDGE